MAKVGIIANPHAKLNKQKPKLQETLLNLAYNRALFRQSEDLGHLIEIANEFASEGVDTLAVVGGDGTLSQCLSAFTEAYKDRPMPDIALLRGGTMNMLAQNLKLHGSPEERLNRLLSPGAVFRRQEVLSLKILDKIGFTFASGTSALFLEEFYKGKKSVRSCLNLIMRLASSYLADHKFFNEIVISQNTILDDGKALKLEKKMISVLVATIDKLPMALPFFPGSLDDPSAFTVLAVTHSPRELAFSGVLDLLFFPRLKSRKKLRFRCESLSIIPEQNSIYTIDGDVYRPIDKKIVISKGPLVSFLLF